jgi:hypothetical protein
MVYSERKILHFIQTNWPILAFIVGLIMTWANMQNAIGNQNIAIASQEKRINSLEVEIKNIGISQAEINAKLTGIQIDLQWIKNQYLK